MLRSLHLRLHAVGRSIGWLVGFALFLALGSLAFISLFVGSLIAGFQAATMIGGGDLLGFLLFWLIFGLFAWYVGPYIMPQLRKALSALLDEPQQAPRPGDREPGV